MEPHSRRARPVADVPASYHVRARSHVPGVLAPSLRLPKCRLEVQLFGKEIDRAYPRSAARRGRALRRARPDERGRGCGVRERPRLAAGVVLGAPGDRARRGLAAPLRRRALAAAPRRIPPRSRVPRDRRRAHAVREPRGRSAGLRRRPASRRMDAGRRASGGRRARGGRFPRRAIERPRRRGAPRRACRARRAQARTRHGRRGRRRRRPHRRRVRGDRSPDALAPRSHERLRSDTPGARRPSAPLAVRVAVRRLAGRSKRGPACAAGQRILPPSLVAPPGTGSVEAARAPAALERAVRNRRRDAPHRRGGAPRGRVAPHRAGARGQSSASSSRSCRSSNATTSSSTRRTTDAPCGICEDPPVEKWRARPSVRRGDRSTPSP